MSAIKNDYLYRPLDDCKHPDTRIESINDCAITIESCTVTPQRASPWIMFYGGMSFGFQYPTFMEHMYLSAQLILADVYIKRIYIYIPKTHCVNRVLQRNRINRIRNKEEQI